VTHNHARRSEILRIVRDHAVHSQEELLVLLRKRGMAVTQPTLSRDLRELGLVKTAEGYVAPESLAPVATLVPRQSREQRFEQLVREFLLSADPAVNLVVIRTPPAGAQPLASAIDALGEPEILGTIGGDDTIFVALRTPAAAAGFARRLHQIAGLARPRRTRA
jgi:transcriptional regulator of arginine metabolism